MSRVKKRYWLPPLIVLGFLVAFAIAIDPIVEWQTRKALRVFEPRYVTSFEDASVNLSRMKYVLEGFKVQRPSAGADELPYITAKRTEVGIYWRELLHGHLVVETQVEGGRLNLIAAKQERDQQLDPKIPDLAQKLADLLPLEVDRIQLRDAAFLFTDKTNADFPKIWIHKVDGTVENLATRAALARGEPTSVAISGTIQDTGELSVFLTADPLAKGLFFAGRTNITNLQLSELSKVMASETGVRASEGTLDVFVEFDCRAGKVKGGIKPVLKNVKVVKGEPGVVNALKAAVANAALNVLSDRVGEREAVATVVPFHGDLTDPKLELWPTVIGVLRNAFVVGVSEGYSRLPPLEGDTNPVKQLREGLDKKKSPKVEPGRN